MKAALQLFKKVLNRIPLTQRLYKSLYMALQAKIEKHDRQEIQLLPWEKRMLRLPDFSCLLDIESGMAGHQLFLFNLTRETKAQEVLEIGLGTANSTLAFLMALRETGGRLTSIESSPLPEAISRIAKAGLENHWRLVQGLSQGVRSQFLTGFHVDILFIDGNHSYNQCKLDYKLYEPLVHAGGYIIFHDSATIAGVIKLTKELRRHETECLHFPFCNGIFVVRKPTKRQPGGMIS